MANDDDFTFCQVAVADNQNGVDSGKVFQTVSDTSIEETSSIGDFNGQSDGLLWKHKLPNDGTSSKPGSVGSLSFSVTDASPAQGALNDPGSMDKNKVMQERKTPVRKSAPRAKVPFEKGYSQMDWIKLTCTHPDLAGLRGQSNKRLISLNEVKQHQTEGSMWTVLKGRVYNISPYMKFHPGGVDMLMKAVGKDCTSLFNKYHAWVNAEFLLEKCLVGILDDNQ